MALAKAIVPSIRVPLAFVLWVSICIGTRCFILDVAHTARGGNIRVIYEVKNAFAVLVKACALIVKVATSVAVAAIWAL